MRRNPLFVFAMLACGSPATDLDAASPDARVAGRDGGRGGDAGRSMGDGGTSSGVWRPFDDTSPWNTAIDPSPSIDPSSDALVTDFSSIPGQDAFWINIEDYSIPTYWVDSSTPMVNVMAGLGGTGFRTGSSGDGDASGSGMAPIPAGAMPAAGTDRHLLIVDRALGIEWGFWDANLAGADWTAGEASTLDLNGSGVRPPERDSPWWAGHGPRACGFGLIAGLITREEIDAGAIEHALVVAYPHVRSRYYTPPASSAQGTTADAQPDRGVMCGGHIQLDPTLDVTALGLSPAGVAIARALQRYGAFVGDYSGAVSLYADAAVDWSGVLDNGSAQPIPLDRFRVLTIGTTYDNMN